MGFVAGWIFIALGLVYLVYTPDLWMSTPTRDPMWPVFSWGLLVSGAALVLTSTLAADMRYHYLHRDDRAPVKRGDGKAHYVMGIYEITVKDRPGGRGRPLKRLVLAVAILVVLAVVVLYVQGVPVPEAASRYASMHGLSWSP